jgi:hypothetical protein
LQPKREVLQPLSRGETPILQLRTS